jgi:hypothetical protein
VSEEVRRVGRLRWKNQLLTVPLSITLLKYVIAAVIYYLPGKIATAWNLFIVTLPTHWLYLFAAWDSMAYHLLAADWYAPKLDPMWAYFPFYPASMRFLGLTGLDLWLTGFVISQIAGFASILIFRKIANEYLDDKESAVATILYFLLPPVFVFTTVSYNESLFLLFSLITWHAHIRRKEKISAFFASLATLTRSYGLLIVVPLAYDQVRRKQLRQLLVLGFPFAALIGWLYYAFLMTGNVLAPFVAESYWNTEIVAQIQKSMSLLFTHGDFGVFQILLRFQRLVIFGIGFVALITWLCFRAYKMNKSLGVYAFTFLLFMGSATIAFVPTFVALPRYLSMIFPSGLSLKISRKPILWFVVGSLALLDILAWWMFLFTDSFH